MKEIIVAPASTQGGHHNTSPVTPISSPTHPIIMQNDAAPAPTPHRILVVDDNVDAAESLAILLQVLGHTTKTAHDGLTALDRARAFKPDTIFLDIGLPKMDGYEVARRLRQDPGLHPQPLLVALTGHSQEEDRQRAHAAGFDRHLVKPVEMDQLTATLERPIPRP